MDRKKFAGTIKRGDLAFSVIFEAWAGGDSRLQIEIEAISVQSLLALKSAMGEPGSFSEALVLEGTSAEGATFSQIVPICAGQVSPCGFLSTKSVDLTRSAIRFQEREYRYT